MQTAYEIGKGNAEEAIDQAEGLIARDPKYYSNIGDVLESYATNAMQTDSSLDGYEIIRGFVDVLKAKKIAYRPHGFN